MFIVECSLHRMDNIFSSLLREGSSKEIRTAIETLLTIHRNICQNPNDDKYRKIQLNNKAFENKVWRFKSARLLMLRSGWKQENPFVVFYGDNILKVVIDLLLENRFIIPSECEWTNDDKLEGKSEAQLREEELKKKAIEERDRELAEFLKDKKERELIAKNIKEDHAADVRRRRFLHPEKAINMKKNRGRAIGRVRPDKA